MILCGYNVDTLNICMKEFIIFVCTDSTEIFLSKLRSSCLNYNLPSFFTDSYCAGGVSNKHCLLTFFIYSVYIVDGLQNPGVYVVSCVGEGNRRDVFTVYRGSHRRRIGG